MRWHDFVIQDVGAHPIVDLGMAETRSILVPLFSVSVGLKRLFCRGIPARSVGRRFIAGGRLCGGAVPQVGQSHVDSVRAPFSKARWIGQILFEDG